MMAAVIEKPGRIEIQEVPEPVLAKDDVLVRVLAATICGSDLHILRGTMEGIHYPVIPGHEWVGEVVAAGPKYEHLTGKRVVSDLLEHCGTCTQCHRHQLNLCADLVEPGLTRPGAFAERLAVRGSNVHVLPDDFPADVAPLVEPLAVALYALKRVPIEAGQTVAVLGGGGVGQLILRCVVANGGKAYMVDPHPGRRQLALVNSARDAFEPGADLAARWRAQGLRDPDVTFDVAGSADAFATALELTAPNGRVGVVGYSGAEKTATNPSLIMSKLLTIIGVLSPTGTWQTALDLVVDGAISLDGLISHRFPLTEISQAFELAKSRKDGALRIALVPQ